MVPTVLKDFICRSSPKELIYGDYKNFDRNIFKRELQQKVNSQINVWNCFEQIFFRDIKY